jgi:hypothetical protein
MNYVVEIGSSAMICTRSFKKFGSAIQKLIGWIHIKRDRHAHRQQGYITSLPLFFRNKESRLKILDVRINSHMYYLWRDVHLRVKYTFHYFSSEYNGRFEDGLAVARIFIRDRHQLALVSHRFW